MWSTLPSCCETLRDTWLVFDSFEHFRTRWVITVLFDLPITVVSAWYLLNWTYNYFPVWTLLFCFQISSRNCIRTLNCKEWWRTNWIQKRIKQFHNACRLKKPRAHWPWALGVTMKIQSTYCDKAEGCLALCRVYSLKQNLHVDCTLTVSIVQCFLWWDCSV